MSFSDIDKELVDSLLIFFRRIEELRKTRFYSYYKKNVSEVSIQFEGPTKQLEITENELDDENDEFLRSFVAILRLFLLDIDNFSLRYLAENYFNPDQGLLFQLFPNESNVFNNLRSALKDFLNSKPQLDLIRGFRDKDYSFESNLEMLYNFAYGGLIHSNIDKLEKYFVFNLHVNEGKNAIFYPTYRNYIIFILLNILNIIDQISTNVIEKIISEVLNYHINKGNELYHTETTKANTHYNSALYIANLTEDYENRILIHQVLEEISYILNDESLAKAHKNKAIEIERAMKGLPPDFSDYNFSFDLRPHKKRENE
ncbi:MAG: hypothetical protein EU529_00760 [Promethearchaeota archaeon]|nr:MAG: hypothetical protein EU529_00760 [Candidatus Lokiarchaeota archaeon]